PKITRYSAEKSNNEFSFIDLDFYPEINKEDKINQPTHSNSQSQNKKHPAFKRTWKACLKKTLSSDSYVTHPELWTCSCPAYLNNRFLLCKHLVHLVRPLSPNFFVEVKCYQTPPFWRHKDLILLAQGLDPVNENESETDKQTENELDELFSDEINEELAKTIQEYEENENENINHTIVEESDEAWEEVNNRITGKLQKWINLLKSQEQYKDP
ncbi:14715_t:CDS:2, partial [Gigaspora rosea]